MSTYCGLLKKKGNGFIIKSYNGEYLSIDHKKEIRITSNKKEATEFIATPCQNMFELHDIHNNYLSIGNHHKVQIKHDTDKIENSERFHVVPILHGKEYHEHAHTRGDVNLKN